MAITTIFCALILLAILCVISGLHVKISRSESLDFLSRKSAQGLNGEFYSEQHHMPVTEYQQPAVPDILYNGHGGIKLTRKRRHFSLRLYRSRGSCNAVTDPCNGRGTCHCETPYRCDCIPGYGGHDCSGDVDECSTTIHACSNDATCHNNIGSYTCSCNNGFRDLMTSGRPGIDCVDINECSTQTDDCSNNAACTNTHGSHTCTCNHGYEGDGKTCTNVNECARGTDTCSVYATCTDTSGSYVCTCNAGYMGDGESCTEIDECDANPCVHGSCTDQVNDYLCSCDDGYDGKSCDQDINECSAYTDDCSNNAACTNTPGSYTCTCNQGYEGDGKTCTNVNECTRGTDTCSIYATCTDTSGSYVCTCNPGYSGNGESCTEINECDDNPCAHGSCTDLVNDYSCSCDDGYNGKNCDQDVDECNDGTHQCSDDATCMNVFGSYTCTCNNGYDGNGITCSDVDECNEGTDGCSGDASCTNNVGSYDCACYDGYAGDGYTCSDVDECNDGTDLCSDDATCMNVFGSYTCTCNNGYDGNGITCSDVNECNEGTDGCSDAASCTNNVGSYDCTCYDGYTGDGYVCTDINECESSPCKNGGTCNNLVNHFTCTCEEDYTGNVCETDMCYPSRGADIVVVLDSSSSQDEDIFQRQRDFTKSLINTFPIGANKFRFSIVSVSNVAAIKFGLDVHDTNETLIQAIDDIIRFNGSSNLHLAINAARNEIFTRTSADRTKYLILLGDGLYTNPSETAVEICDARDAGITLLSVGFGSQILQQGLIDTSTNHMHVFSQTTDDLKHWLLKRHVMDACPDCTGNSADVFILLETSNNLGLSVFYGLMDSLKTLMQKIPLGRDRVHVSLATSDDTVTEKFDFETHYSQYSIIASVLSTTSISQNKPNHVDALKHVKDNVFVSSNGHRQGSRKIAILFISETIPDLDAVKEQSDAIKTDDIIVVVITFSSQPKPDIAALLEIVSHPAYLFVIAETVYGGTSAFDALSTLLEYDLCIFD